MGRIPSNGLTARGKIARGLCAVLLGFCLSRLCSSGVAAQLTDPSLQRRSADDASPDSRHGKGDGGKVHVYEIPFQRQTTPSARGLRRPASGVHTTLIRQRSSTQLEASPGLRGIPSLPLGDSPAGQKFTRMASGLSKFNTAAAPTFADESTLLQLAAAWGGSVTGAQTWIPGAPCSAWTGVTCDASGSRVTELTLRGANISGVLPDSISDLKQLSVLDLKSNHLGGSIPSALGSLTALAALDLSFNNLTGSLPASLGHLTGLTSLDLSFNALAGPIPRARGKYLALRELSGSRRILFPKCPKGFKLITLTARDTCNSLAQFCKKSRKVLEDVNKKLTGFTCMKIKAKSLFCC